MAEEDIQKHILIVDGLIFSSREEEIIVNNERFVILRLAIPASALDELEKEYPCEAIAT